jgi:hypothetical protein
LSERTGNSRAATLTQGGTRRSDPQYGELQLSCITETIATLGQRIAERFPDSGLSRVSAELAHLGAESAPDFERLRKPIWALRIGAALGVLAIIALTAGAVYLALPSQLSFQGLGEMIQATEAAVNEIILLALAIFFLVSSETRLKRRLALRALHRLRSIVHIVDMHQLTKDPDHLLSPGMATASSPQRRFNRFELARYLDYCSELLALASKLAALHVQYVNDPVVLDAVNDIESLAAALSNKIWQKIMILDIAGSRGATV